MTISGFNSSGFQANNGNIGGEGSNVRASGTQQGDNVIQVQFGQTDGGQDNMLNLSSSGTGIQQSEAGGGNASMDAFRQNLQQTMAPAAGVLQWAKSLPQKSQQQQASPYGGAGGQVPGQGGQAQGQDGGAGQYGNVANQYQNPGANGQGGQSGDLMGSFVNFMMSAMTLMGQMMPMLMSGQAGQANGQTQGQQTGQTGQADGQGGQTGQTGSCPPNGQQQTGQPGQADGQQGQTGQPGGQVPGQPGGQQTGQPGGQVPGQPGGQQNGQTGQADGQQGQPGGQIPGQPGGQQNGQTGQADGQGGQTCVPNGGQQNGQADGQQGQPGGQVPGQPGQPGTQGPNGQQQPGQPGQPEPDAPQPPPLSANTKRELGTMKFIKQNLAGIDDKYGKVKNDGKLDKGDLEKLLGDTIDPGQRMALQNTIDNFDQLKRAGSNDNTIEAKDLDKIMTDLQASPGPNGPFQNNSLDTLRYNQADQKTITFLNGNHATLDDKFGDGNGVFKKEELQTILDKGNLPEDGKASLKAIIDNFDKLDNKDHVIDQGQLEKIRLDLQHGKSIPDITYQ